MLLSSVVSVSVPTMTTASAQASARLCRLASVSRAALSPDERVRLGFQHPVDPLSVEGSFKNLAMLRSVASDSNASRN